MLGRCLNEEGEVGEAEYAYLASLLRKALKDTREEDAQKEGLLLAEQIVLLRKEG
jgi:hypothetical protein